MLAARLYGKEDLRLKEVAIPQINSDEVLLEVKSAFICGTDVRMYRNGYKNVSAETPLTLGHELSGVIEKVGKDVTHYKEGVRVAVAPNMGCGICDMCVSGNTHLCMNYMALGISLDGVFAQYVRVPAIAVGQGNIVEIDESMSFAKAALAEPLSCVYNNFQRCAITAGDVVLVMGSGPIGIMHAKLAKAAGASKVLVSDLLDARLDICKKADESFVILTGADIKEKVMDITSGKGVNVCITACPAAKAQESSLELTAINGRIMFFGGLPAGTKVNLDTNLIHYKQLVVSGTTRASMIQFRNTLNLIANNIIEVESLVTESFNIKDFKSALDRAAKGIGLKNEITFN